MQITRTSPIHFNIKPISGSTLNLKFIVKGSRDIIKITIYTVIYFKNPIHRNMTDMIGSDILGISTFIEDKAYRLCIKIPKFINYTQSYIVFDIDPNESLNKKVFIEDINVEISSQKIDRPVIEEIPLKNHPINHTVNDILERMINQHNRTLPKDSQKRISYIYSRYSNDSFNIVASNHIKYLNYRYLGENKYIEIEEIDWSQLGSINWNEKRNVLLHPFLYPFASHDSFMKNSRNFAKLLGMKNKIGGFDVADSNRISKLAVDLVNKIDLMLVPSKFAKDAYINSGVTIPVEILPHGISDEFLRDNNEINNDKNNDKNIDLNEEKINKNNDKNIDLNEEKINKNNDKNIDFNEKINKKNNIDIEELRRVKKYGNILILYFLVHSEHRKGADLVRNVMTKIQKKFPNTFLVVKGPNHNYFSGIRTIYIGSWLSKEDLISLYDICDICLSPSRGGGFELNALEAASRGIPTLVTNGGCFLDLIDYFIPISLSNKVIQPLPGNPVHIGCGFEVDTNDLEFKLTDTINRLEYWKNHFKNNSYYIRERYSWRDVAKILNEYLIKYHFIE